MSVATEIVIANWFRIFNAILAFLYLPILSFRIRHINLSGYTPVGFCIGMMCCAIINASYSYYGSVLHVSTVFTFIAISGLFFIGIRDEIKYQRRKKNVGGSNGKE